jgi:N-acetylneuraminic acid mutarotase
MKCEVRREEIARRLLLSVLAATALLGPVAWGDAGAASGEWTTAPPMRHARAAHAVVATADAIFALAGTGRGGKPVLEVERFDGRAWQPETTLPGAGLNATAAAFVGGKLYVIGGFDTSTNVPTSRVHVYDPATKTWAEAAPLPRPRGGHAAVVVGRRIHVIGGGNSESTIADHSVYDVERNAWTDRTPLPRSEGSPAGVAHRGIVYAIGGRSGPSDFGDVYAYDAAADAWKTAPPIEPRGTAGAVVYCGAIHLFGGESQKLGRSLATVETLDEGSGRWLPLASMPTARNFARAVVLGDAVYVVGGSPSAGNSHASEGSAIVERYRRRC